MAVDLPRRLYGEGLEPEVKKINNCCVMSTLEMLREGLEEEYKVVMEDPLFSHIMAIEKNGLKFSARVVQSFLCKELITSKKHEKLFVFARRPMRFSLLEFHAITGLKVKQENKCGVVRWKYDKGFWSVLLRKGEKINLKMVKERYMEECSSWTRVDRIQLIYLCVIMGVVLGKDQKVNFPHLYIKLEMDLEKLRNYPWGVAAFDCLVDSIDKTRHKLEQKEGYMMAGFLFAFQIWIMEAISAIGEICGKKVSENYTGPSCGNWTGCAKCSYGDIIEVESLLREKGTSQSVISHFNTDGEFIPPAEFVRKNEKKDERVDHIVEMLISEHDWRAHQWGVIDAPVTEIEEADEEENEAGCDESGDTETGSDGSGDGSGNGSGVAEEVAATKKRKIVDSGADTRKKKVLCHLAASTSTKAVSLDSEMKTFIEGLLTASFTTFAEKVSADFAGRMEKLETNVSERLGKMESEVTQLKTALTLHDQARKSTDDTERLGKMETEITQLKTALMVKDLGGKATQESGPSKSKSVTTASKKKVTPKRKR